MGCQRSRLFESQVLLVLRLDIQSRIRYCVGNRGFPPMHSTVHRYVVAHYRRPVQSPRHRPVLEQQSQPRGRCLHLQALGSLKSRVLLLPFDIQHPRISNCLQRSHSDSTCAVHEWQHWVQLLPRFRHPIQSRPYPHQLQQRLRLPHLY